MTPTVGRKLSLYTAAAVLIATSAVGYVSYCFIEAKFAEILRRETLDNSALLASRVRNDLRHAAEKGRVLAAAALEEFKNPDDQIRFLEDNLAVDEQFLAFTLHRKSTLGGGNWGAVFRVSRPVGDAYHLTEDDYRELDLKYPLDLTLCESGAVEVAVGALKDNTPILRMAVPIVQKKGAGFTQILGIEVRQERLISAFAEATANFSFVLDRHGRVLMQTDPTHFTPGEDLSYLPALLLARSSDAPNGNLDYSELPGTMLQYGAFHKVGFADLVVVSEAPHSLVVQLLREYTRQAGLLGLAAIFIALAFAGSATWGLVGARLARIRLLLSRIGDGRFQARFPDLDADDEIGEFSRKLQDVCDQLRSYGTYAKLRSRRARNRLESGKLRLGGDRGKAFVLYGRLHGIEEAIGKSDPEKLVSILNEFNQSVMETVENNHGVMDQMSGVSYVAYWGVPASDSDDAENALSACLELRERVKELNAKLAQARLPGLALRLGMHYGTVVAGELGSLERVEYTVMGEALEVAIRAQLAAGQATDLLVTGPAATAAQGFALEKVGTAAGVTFDLYKLSGRAGAAAALKRKPAKSASAAA